MSDRSALIDPWPGPHCGLPPWNEIATDQFQAAFERAIRNAETEVEEIASNEAPPTFENTIIPLEMAGEQLERVEAIFWVHANNLCLGPIPDLQKSVLPKLAAYRDCIVQNHALFRRIESIQQGDEIRSLDDDQRRLVTDHFRSFVRNGAKLSDEHKSRLTEINQSLASLYAEFTQNVLDDEQAYVTWIEDESRLSGLPANLVSMLANAANERGRANAWAVLNTRSSVDPFLTYADDRELREQVWRTFYDRGDNDGPHNNNQIVADILQLRLERAKLLGYATHAHWQLEKSMAKTPQAAMDLMMGVWPKAVARVEQEVADMQQLADQLDHQVTIEAWDYRYYAEKVRKEKYGLDFNEVKPYLQLEKLIEAMLWCSSELFELEYQILDDVPTFHEDVRVWEVRRHGNHVGLFYLDPYAREGKRSGAWMTEYRGQSHIEKPITPLVSNNSNFLKPAAGETVLISWDDAETLFHEFGHALHGLLSSVRYPSQSGTNVVRDYVEFPSQIFEHWLSTTEVLNRFCVHAETGQPIPQELVEKIKQAATFNQGFATVEYLASAILDLKLHLDESRIEARTFEKTALGELGMPKEMAMRHRIPHFLHLFSDDGYSAAYYSYMWADVLTADAAEAFSEQNSFFDRELANRLYAHVLSVGDTRDPDEGYKAFRGRSVEVDALLRKRGFPVST